MATKKASATKTSATKTSANKTSAKKGEVGKAKAGPARKASAKATPAQVAVQGITPFLWFESGAEEAARFYVSLFKGSRMGDVSPMVVEFNLAGQDFLALNGGPSYKLTPAYSMFVSVRTQAEVDALWSALSKGGEKGRCGWLVDRFGLSWQVIPQRLPELLGHEDPEVAQRALQAMLKMDKIDVAKLEKAARAD